MPNDQQSEQVILGGMLLFPEAITTALASLDEVDFYRGEHRLIFARIRDLASENKHVDLITLRELLERRGEMEKAGGPAYLASLTNDIQFRNYEASAYIDIVKEKAARRKAVSEGTRFTDAAWSGNGNLIQAARELQKCLPQIVSDLEKSEQEEPYIEFAPSFLAVDSPATRCLIGELIPEESIILQHGEPRTFKTWAALDECVALATGTPAFGLPRFSADCAVPVLYSSQEDAARETRIRAKALLQGRGINEFPDTLAFAVHKGINLEQFEWQEALLRDIARHGFRLVVLDPIRRYAPSVDKGPAEVRTITAFLRRLVVETRASIVIIHHDVKPGLDNKDDRRRSHKASGGDWFAAAECPIAFELAGEGRTLAIPEDYKFSVDPQPFLFRLETDDPRNPTWARLVGESSSVEDAKLVAAQQKILDYLGGQVGGASGNAIAKALRIRREDVKGVLDNLFKSGQVDCIGTSGRGKKQTWFLRVEEQKEDD
ncbi:MAG: DnaB-like helicase N-terminal domain-containing protein [Acidobacteriota bacterium]